MEKEIKPRQNGTEGGILLDWVRSWHAAFVTLNADWHGFSSWAGGSHMPLNRVFQC
jgi:hypothetical protein